MKHTFRPLALVLVLLGLFASAAAGAPVPAALFDGMSWREIGPYRGGRIAAVAGVPNQPDTYYLGAAIGGVWRTTDGGQEWEPIFDHQAVGSVGAIAIAASDPNTIYVGTGESAPREDVSFGDGMYKSTDGGKTWTHIGLDDTQHIARIVVDPSDPKTVLVAALGHVYGPNSERGVFRTTDGGLTWKKVLYKDDQSGAIELAADPDNPKTVFAALWQMGRTPWSLSSGGPGSGLYKSIDGGATWSAVTGGGFAKGIIGKIGVTVAAGTNGRRVYALVEATDGGLYRSDDGGTTWRLANDDHRLWSRAWYFTKIWAHPKNPDIVYVAGGSFWKSTDGAKNFERVGIPGADNHDFWINPSSPDHMIEGFDQGVAISVDGGRTWDKRNNLPIGQFYHVSTDRAFPYSVYAAQQDIGAIAIASRGWGGITERDWFNVGGDDAECGFVWPDPLHPNLVVAGGYAGALTVFDKETHQLRDIAPWSNANGGHPASDLKYRFTWTSPVVFSPHDPQLLYMGSQSLMSTRDGGSTWKVISPDLTRNDRSKQGRSGGPITKDDASVEYYDVIFAIAPSPLRAGQIWIGTDDGLVQLSTDGGSTWTKVTPPGLPEWAKISMIEPSPFDADTAYVAVDAHKLDDFAPYIFRTHDNGRSWTRIMNGLRSPAHVYAVREDPKRRGLLFAGTETGVYVSFDDGDDWQPLQLNLPTTSIRDLAVHDDDLVVATHGRSIWILDAIEPLREATVPLAAEPLHLFAPRTALRIHEAGTYTVPVEPAGANPPDGAILDYTLASAAKNVSLTVVDSQGRTAFAATSGADKLPSSAGMHRVTWNLRYPLPPLIPTAVYNERPPRGVFALPGSYTVRLTADGRTVTAPLTVGLDPRVKVTEDALAAEFALASRLMEMLGEIHAAAHGIMEVRQQMAAVRPKLPAHDAELLSSIDRQAGEILNAIYEPQAKTGTDLLNDPMQLNVRVAYLEDEVDFGDGAPTSQFEEMTGEYRRDLDAQLARWQQLRSTGLAELNRRLTAKGLVPITCCSAIPPKSARDTSEEGE